jgi:hypothetical protein
LADGDELLLQGLVRLEIRFGDDLIAEPGNHLRLSRLARIRRLRTRAANDHAQEASDQLTVHVDVLLWRPLGRPRG